MKQLLFLALLFASTLAFSQTEIVEGDVDATDTLYLVIEEGEIDLEPYFRLNYVERSNGGNVVYNRTAPETTTPFLARLINEQEQWLSSIASLEAEVVRLTAKIAEFEAIEAVIDAKITELE